MATRHSLDGGRGHSLGIVRAGSGNVRATLIAIALVVVGLVVMTVVRGQRVAAWAPVDVVSSRDPLQELPIRTASEDGVVRPANTYDAVVDMSRLSSLVVGVDLDFIPKGATRYDAVIRDDRGAEIFRDAIGDEYFADGRFMLRLFARRFHKGEYLLEIEAGDGGKKTRVVTASWFQVIS